MKKQLGLASIGLAGLTAGAGVGLVLTGVVIVLLNFMIDVLYGYVDPRVRLSR